MRIHGYLSQGDVYTILRMLARSRASGLLRLHADDHEATLAVHGAHVLRASVCSGPSLGEALVMSGAVEPDEIEEALQVQSWVVPRRRLGSILVDRGAVSKPHVSEALTEGIRDVILLAATWTSGTYEFAPRIGVDWDETFGGVAIASLVPEFESRRCVPRGH